MMLVNIEIAARRNLEIESAMTGKQLEHVIEEANAGGNLVASAPVQVQPDADVSLCGLAVDFRASRSHANHPVWE
jgi:ribosomal protein L12E/L44/L45/RPP1/RPP2